MQNLELKVRCLNGASLERIAALASEAGAVYMRTLKQRDTYFPAPHARLKLREWWHETTLEGAGGSESARRPDRGHSYEQEPTGAVLISYVRPDHAGSRMSDYLICPVSEPLMLRTLLSQTLGVQAVIEKRRQLYIYGHTRIHLDEVRGLGSFVELETVIDEGITLEEASAEHSAVISLLELDRLPVIPYSYSDLLDSGPD